VKLLNNFKPHKVTSIAFASRRGGKSCALAAHSYVLHLLRLRFAYEHKLISLGELKESYDDIRVSYEARWGAPPPFHWGDKITGRL